MKDSRGNVINVGSVVCVHGGDLGRVERLIPERKSVSVRLVGQDSFQLTTNYYASHIEVQEYYPGDMVLYVGYTKDMQGAVGEIVAMGEVVGRLTVDFGKGVGVHHLGGGAVEPYNPTPPNEPCVEGGLPSHYDVFEGIKAIEITARSMTEEAFYGFCLGNVIKYHLRAGRKVGNEAEEDLAKAESYRRIFNKYKGECHDKR